LCRTMPMLDNDPDKPDDVDTDGEDHWYDAFRYLLMGIGVTPIMGTDFGSTAPVADLLGGPLLVDLGGLGATPYDLDFRNYMR